MASFCSSNDKRNFQWVTAASVDLIKLPLIDILASHIKPKDLFQTIQSSSTLKLLPDQRKFCLIQPPGPDYNTFDFTLLYTLIRNLCCLPSPAQGWGKEPKTTDTQISDDIERLRLFRNNYYAHATSASISDGEFEDVWRNLKLVIKRFNSKIKLSVDYEEELIRIEYSKFTDDHLKTCRILLDAFANTQKQTDRKDEPDVSIKGENEKKCGETALFEADVENVQSSSWTITWQKRKGIVIELIDTGMKKYWGSTKRRLVIKSVCKEDEGEYQAVLSFESNGPDYKSKNTIRLYVFGEVPSVKIIVDSSVCFGSTTTIKSDVLSTPKPQKIEWQKSKDKTKFLSTEKPILFNSTDIFTSPSYVIPKTTFTDKLYYRLLVWNEIGESVSNTVYLNVTGSPPNIMTNLETNIENRSVKLICRMYFYDDSPDILETLTFWTKNEKKIVPEKSGGKLLSEIINDTPSLTIRNVSPDDAGEYRLTATNAVGSSTSDVIVLGIPTVYLEKIEDKENEGQMITVKIKSLPAPFNVQWSVKSENDKNFRPIDINTKEYEGTTVSFPHPVLVVRQRDQLEKNCFKIEVTNFIGKTEQEISDNGEETPYNDHGASFRFTKLNNILADQFPPEQVEKLKFSLETSNKVKNRKSLLEANSAMACLKILQKEKLFTQKDVIFMQFLCKETGCLELNAKCIEYAEKQKALCFFEKPPVNGCVDVQFHVQGDISSYTKEFIRQVIETVAAILDCEEEDIKLNGVKYSTSFFLSLLIKKVYIRKLLVMKEQDRLNLKNLNIDYLKIDEETIRLNRGEDLVNKISKDTCHLCSNQKNWSYDNITSIGFLNMPTDDEYMYAVKKSFVFLKENINFEYMEHWLIQNDIITTKEIEDYITQDKAIHFRSERLLKWLIWKRKCKAFVLILDEMRCDNHIPEEIARQINNNLRETQSSLTGDVNSRPHFDVTGNLLQRHFSILYTVLEPRNIADFMFQEGHISVEEHDMMTIPPKKHKRLKNLLDILEKRQELYVSFLCTLNFLKFTSVLETLKTDQHPENIPSNCILCIQHNFTLLQEELPDPDHATAIMEYVLDKSAISEIENCSGKIRQKSKLVKKILEGREYSCRELLRVIEVCLKRSDLITTMEINSAEKLKRGRPGLPTSFSRLNISCLQEYEGILLKELDPLEISDLLFEEEAIDIIDHDQITETAIRLEQTKCLLDTVKENRNDCFHFFLFTLQRNDKYNDVCEELEKPTSAAISDESSKQPHWTFSHAILREPVDVLNKNIQLKLSVEGPTGAPKEHVLFKSINSHDTEVRVETINKGQMIFERADSGSIIIQLRPVTDHAVQTLLKAKENNRLLEMIIGMLENVKMDKMVHDTEQLQIRVQVYYVDSATAKQYTKTSRTTLIKHRVNVHRNTLVHELEPTALVSVLSKSKALTERDIPSIFCVENRNCKIEVENLLLMVEMGSAEFVEEFVATLKGFGYCDIVELIDPSGFPSSAEYFKKNIMSNYKNILSKMNMRFASETLSKCIGDVDLIREKIQPQNGNHRQRMNTFLQFILQDDNNVMEFERMLRNYGLEELLKKDESKETKDIEVTIVEDPVPSSSEGILFESVITFSKIVMTDTVNKRKIIIAMDGSKYSEGALKWFAKNMYQKDRDEVIVLHVTDHRNSSSFGSNWMPIDPTMVHMAYKEEEEKAKVTIKKLDAILMDAGVQGNVVQVHGFPGEQIIQKSEELGVTMIIIASRGLGKIRRTILGSVSDYVVHHSSVPVIVCRH